LNAPVHLWPQLPQFFLLEFVSTQSPQSVSLGGQTQWPYWQSLKYPVHVVSQLPQLSLFHCVSTHCPLHSVCPVGHAQLPPWHVFPPVHRFPQPPQLALSVSMSTQLSPQHALPKSVLQQLAPQATSPANATQQSPFQLHDPAQQNPSPQQSGAERGHCASFLQRLGRCLLASASESAVKSSTATSAKVERRDMDSSSSIGLPTRAPCPGGFSRVVGEPGAAIDRAKEFEQASER